MKELSSVKITNPFSTRKLSKFCIKTVAYHPCANGLVERFQRQIKTALAAQIDPTKWREYLPIILLGFRYTIKEDVKSTAAEMAYGTRLRLPGEIFHTT